MRLRNCFLCCMLFFWIGIQNGTGQIFRAQNKPEVLFENIYVGDDLEKCFSCHYGNWETYNENAEMFIKNLNI